MSVPSQLFTNNAVSLLAAAIGAGDTSLTVMTGYGGLFPQPVDAGDFFVVTLENETGTAREILKVEGRSGDTFTNITRAQEGTVAQAWSASLGSDTLVDHRVTAETMRQALLQPVSGGGGGTSLDLYSENPSTPTSPASPGVNAVAIGFGAEAGAAKSLAVGEQSLTRIPGSISIASGRFGTQGDAQIGKYLVRGTTPGNAPTELLVDGTGGSIRLTLTDDTTWTFRATVTAHETTGSGHAGFEIVGVIYRTGGAASTSLQGAVNVSVIGRSSPSWKATASADTVNGSLKITVTGQNGKIIRWLAHVETVEVTN